MTWKNVRKALVKETFRKIATAPDETLYFEALGTQFTHLELTDVEQDIHCDESLRLLLMGFEADDIRLVWDKSDFARIKPIGLKPNPSFEPRIRSYITSFDDIISYLCVIYNITQQVQRNYSESRLARAVLRMISEKSAELVDGILLNDPSQQAGYFDRCLLLQQINLLRKPLKCYADTVLSIYQEGLVGGHVLDFLNEKVEQSVLEEKNVYTKCKNEAWKVYMSILCNWMSYGELTDPCKDLFIWPTKGISSLKLYELGKMIDNEFSKESSDFVIIPELCPQSLKHILLKILRCGIHARALSENNDVSGKPLLWEVMNEFEFIRNVTTTEKENAKAELQDLRDKHSLFDYIDELQNVLTLKPIVPAIVRALSRENLLRRNYLEVSKAMLNTLSLKLLSSKDSNTAYPIYDSAKLVKTDGTIFDDIRRLQKTPVSSSQDNETPLPHILSLELAIPVALQKVFPDFMLKYMLLTFRLHLVLNVASYYEEESRRQLPKEGKGSIDRRPEYILLQKLGRHIFDIKRTLNIAVLNARLLYKERLSEVSSVDQLVMLQWDFCSKIMQDTFKGDPAYLRIIEELVTLIDFFSQSIGNSDMLERVEEEYNAWLETKETFECQSGDV